MSIHNIETYTVDNFKLYKNKNYYNICEKIYGEIEFQTEIQIHSNIDANLSDSVKSKIEGIKK